MREQRTFFVGEWQVLPAEDTLCQEHRCEKLEPLAMEVLLYLASRQGEVVSRAELEGAVWRGGMVGYDAVTNTVIKLRKALGDSARNPRFIATIPKRGYQLVAPVRETRVEATSNPAAESASTGPLAAQHQTGAASRGDRAKVGLMLLILALAAALAWFGLSRLTPPSPQPGTDAPPTEPPSIVVLPFENLSDDPLQERFADGMTEDLITDLSGIAGLSVIASNTSFSYKGRRVPPQQIRSDLSVDFVLEGSVRRRGDSLRVNAQLVDATSAFQVWAERYDRPLEETFAVQDELSNRIVETLAVRLNSQEKQRLARQPTNNLAAYDHFQEWAAPVQDQYPRDRPRSPAGIPPGDSE